MTTAILSRDLDSDGDEPSPGPSAPKATTWSQESEGVHPVPGPREGAGSTPTNPRAVSPGCQSCAVVLTILQGIVGRLERLEAIMAESAVDIKNIYQSGATHLSRGRAGPLAVHDIAGSEIIAQKLGF